jgi:hypothetical protein
MLDILSGYISVDAIASLAWQYIKYTHDIMNDLVLLASHVWKVFHQA